MTKDIHWADKFAEKIIKWKQKDEYLVESGVTPSGIVHAGNFREIFTQELVFKAFLDKGVKVKYQYFWDDYDRFRKVPAGVPEKWNEYIGLPTTKIPDPWECHDSYAEHFKSKVIKEMEAVGIECEFKSAAIEYAKGTFVEHVKTALENTKKIKEIHDKFRKEPLPEDWLPIRLYCEKCGKDTTKTKYLGKYKIEYKCECGEKDTINFKEKPAMVKLPWRIDWPMRWAYYDVDFESSGKEHQASGGSVSTGVPICKEIFNHEPPMQPMYEFIYFKGQKEKMSSSKGNVVTISDLLEVYEPELVRYMYTSKVSKSFDISFDADLLNAYNYFDKARKIYWFMQTPLIENVEVEKGKIEKKIDNWTNNETNEARKYELSKLSKEYQELPQFSVCVNVIQIAVGNIEKAKEILKKTGHNPEYAEQRLQLAWNWVNKYAPEQFKFTVKENLDEIKKDIRLNTWSDEIKELLSETADEIKKGIEGQDLQQFIFETAKKKEIPVKIAFLTFYQLLLGKSRGPKLGPFLSSLDKDFVIKRLRLEQ